MLPSLPAAGRLPAVAAAALVLVVVVVVCRRTGWTRTRRGRARALLYGAFALLLGAGAWWGVAALDEGRQAGLLTKVSGAEVVRAADPDRARRMLEEVLAAAPDDDVRRRATLGLAASLDALERFADAEAAYAAADRDWPAGTPRGALVLPWASMRVRAGRPAEALTLLATPGATEGFGDAKEAEQVFRELKARAEAALAPKADPNGR